MKSVIESQEHEQFLKKVLYASPFRFFLGAGGLYFAISMVLDGISGEGLQVFSATSLLETFVTSILWSAIFSLIFLPVMKMTSQKISDAKPAQAMEASGYTLYAPCSHKQSKLNSIGGMLYIGPGKVCFKPHKLNINGAGVEWLLASGETLTVSYERQRVTLLARVMYKVIPECLVLSSQGRRLALIAASPEKIIEALRQEGLLKGGQ